MPKEPDEIQEKYKELMNRVASAIDTAFNGEECPADKKTTGFTLFIYDFDKGPEAGKMNYISNADRMDFYVSLKEMLAHMEGRLINNKTEQ